MTTHSRDWEAENRDLKVQALTAHLRAVHQALPPRLPLDVWVRSPHFPWAAMERAARLKRPCSEVTKQMVLAELRGEAA